MRAALISSLAVLAVACRSVPPTTQATNELKFVGVASVGGMDGIAQTHVMNVLRKHGVEAHVEGSILHGVSVCSEDRERAIEILRHEQTLNEHPITLPPGLGARPTAPGPTWKELPVRGPHREVIERPDLWPEVRAMLTDRDVTSSVDDFPFVFRVRVLPRRYVDWDGETRTGFDAEVEMAADPEARFGLKEICYNVLSGGRDVQSPCSRWWGGLTTRTR